MPMLTLSCPKDRRGRPAYSSGPWRLGLRHPDGTIQELWYAGTPVCFARKREGMPVLAALRALGADLSIDMRQWTEEKQKGFTAILEATDVVRAWRDFQQCGTVAPGRG